MKAEQIEEIQKYIAEHFADNSLLDYFSQKYFYDKSYLCAEYKRHTGTTIGELIRRKRYEKAKEYLESGRTIEWAIKKVGYSKRSYRWFTDHYKKYVGETPRETRDRWKGAKKCDC